MRYLFRNRISGASFVVVGDEARDRMLELAGWELQP